MTTKDETIEELSRVLDDAAALLSQAIEYAENELQQPVYTAVQDDKMIVLANWCESARKTLAEANTLI